jgi:hypothetical protein
LKELDVVVIRTARLGSVKCNKPEVITATVVKNLIYPTESQPNNGAKITED